MPEFPEEFPNVEDLRSQLDHEDLHPWTVETTPDNKDTKFQLHDDIHSIAKYTVLLNAGVEFTMFAFNWPIQDNHIIYDDRKRKRTRWLQGISSRNQIFVMKIQSNLVFDKHSGDLIGFIDQGDPMTNPMGDPMIWETLWLCSGRP